MEERSYRELPPARGDLGYSWVEQSTDEGLAYLGGFLKRNNAKVYVMDVYATNDKVYRNITIQLPRLGEVYGAEDIYIQFDRNSGRQFSLSRSSE